MASFDLESLYERVAMRGREARAGDSYSARLLERGIERVAQKLGEEAIETLIAAIGLQQVSQQASSAARSEKEMTKQRELCEESADLLYHLCLLWYACGTKPQDVYDVLERRAAERDADVARVTMDYENKE